MKHKFFALTNKSFDDYKVKTYEELWEKVKEDGFTALQAGFVTVFTKAEGDQENLYHAVLSDAIEDRHGDIVKQEWVLTHFKKNPVLLDSHDYSSIEKIIGRWPKIGVKEDKLQGDVEFALMNPRGVLARDMADAGFLTALSAGFIPMEFGEKGEIKKSELLEGSMVSVPANPRTLLEKKVKKVKEAEPEVPPTPDPVLTPAPALKVAKKKVSRVVLMQRELEKQDSVIKAVAKELNKTNEGNLQEKKRRIWKSLREVL